MDRRLSAAQRCPTQFDRHLLYAGRDFSAKLRDSQNPPKIFLMKSRIPRLCLVICAFASVASHYASAGEVNEGSLPATMVPAPPQLGSEYEVHGVCQMGQTLYASIKSPVSGRSQWYQPDEVIDSLKVADISLRRVILRDRKSGKEFVIHTTAAAAGEATAEKSPQRKPFSKAWINSEENPMLRHIQSLPVEVIKEWAGLPAEQKAAIIEFYRNHGWKLLGAEIVNGSSTFYWDNIYEKERSAVVAENRREFEQALSQDQLAAYQSNRRNPMMHVLNGKLTPEQEAESKRRGGNSAKFRASLNPKQLEQMDGIPDFTKKLGVPDVN